MILSTYKIKDMEVIKMEKERKIKVLSLVALIVAVLGLTVAFAALSQTLTINGTASVNAAEWDIHFANLSEPVIEGDATTIKPTLSGTSITGYTATVTKPGDSVIYEFDIVNAGTVDAIISSITIPIKYRECLATGLTDENCKPYDFNDDGYINVIDTSVYAEIINYGLYYSDTDKLVKKNDVLNAGETKRVKLVVEYNYEASRLPKTNFVVADENDPITIEYVQAD